MNAPNIKRTIAFFDCQNLFHNAKKLWHYSNANFNPILLSQLVVNKHKNDGWKLTGIRLYTGIHEVTINPSLNRFWLQKLKAHRAQDSRVVYFKTQLRYDNNGTAREKGVDVRIALDIIGMGRRNEYDVSLLFSQDNDFREVAIELRALAQESQRWIKIVSAFPDTEPPKARGVDKTDWERIIKAEYDSCIDPKNYY